MDKLNQWIALTVVACLGILAAGWFTLVSPKRAEAEDLRTQVASQDNSNATLRTQLAVLKAQAKDLPKQQARLAAVAAKIPENPALPALIRALDAASAEAGVELVSIAPGTPMAVTAAAAAPVRPVAPGAPAVPVAAAATTVGTLTSIPVAIDVVGGYFEVQQFLSGLEGLSRALRVTGVSLVPGSNPVAPKGATTASTEDGKTLNATLTGSVFLAAGAALPVAAAPVVARGTRVVPGAAPAVPAAAPAAVPASPAK